MLHISGLYLSRGYLYQPSDCIPPCRRCVNSNWVHACEKAGCASTISAGTGAVFSPCLPEACEIYWGEHTNGSGMFIRIFCAPVIALVIYIVVYNCRNKDLSLNNIKATLTASARELGSEPLPMFATSENDDGQFTALPGSDE
eukprot:gnl/TRDRNA2_/TRDRNA2_78386_c0_seq1.p1 gnl/TRDRNA2_/TRDRNA2_78386_c0~~gnl/TRDRNA2_/TRDRNA2_78386_c0_seq1.p1  ORF type:complete len:143 (-),score=11.62 gnl/TRDRNA2_/TRDRNA2_78386_c0_seq1:63-491(-)